LAVLVAACGDNAPIFKVEPQIEFARWEPPKVRESGGLGGGDSVATLFIQYKDGDGDLGAKNDNDPPNMFLTDLRPELPITDLVSRDTTINGRDTTVVDTIVAYDGKLNYRLPNMTPEARKPSIQGEIGVELSGLTRLSAGKGQNDTLRFRLYIEDRAGNKSNEIVTEPLIIQPPKNNNGID
jgi:hypothetical protein